MRAEDGTGSRRPSWRCGNVTPPISFSIYGEQLRLLVFYGRLFHLIYWKRKQKLLAVNKRA